MAMKRCCRKYRIRLKASRISARMVSVAAQARKMLYQPSQTLANSARRCGKTILILKQLEWAAANARYLSSPSAKKVVPINANVRFVRDYGHTKLDLSWTEEYFRHTACG